MCRKPAHYKIFREKIPFTITRTLIPKSPRVSQKISQNFLISRLFASIKPLQYAGFLRIEKSFSLILQGNGVKNLHHFKNFSFHFSKDTYPENTTILKKIFILFLKTAFPFTTTRTKSLQRWRSGRKFSRENKKRP